MGNIPPSDPRSSSGRGWSNQHQLIQNLMMEKRRRRHVRRYWRRREQEGWIGGGTGHIGRRIHQAVKALAHPNAGHPDYDRKMGLLYWSVMMRDLETFRALLLKNKWTDPTLMLGRTGASILHVILKRGCGIGFLKSFESLPRERQQQQQQLDFINRRESGGLTPLVLACLLEQRAECEWLLRNGADVNRQVKLASLWRLPVRRAAAFRWCAKSTTALDVACSGGSREIVALLLAAGADREKSQCCRRASCRRQFSPEISDLLRQQDGC